MTRRQDIDLEELLFGLENDTSLNRVWDRQVPIQCVDGVYNAYLSGPIDSPDCYNELCFTLEQASPEDVVILHINTGGGYIDSAFKIIASIKRSKAKVIARLTGTVASAGTIISLSCDDIEVEDFTHFMIHNYSTGTQGKGHEVLSYINFNDKSLRRTFGIIYAGFLNEREVKDVLSGNDMWLDADDVRKRWKLKVKGSKPAKKGNKK